MPLCECGCGQEVKNRFANGHVSRLMSDATRKKLSLAMQGRDAYWMRGDKNVMSDPAVKEKHRLRMVGTRTPETIQKAKETSLQRYGVDNYSKSDEFKNLIRLENHPNWKGGITSERLAYYSRAEWKEIAKAIWKRDAGTCQRCDTHQSEKENSFNIHHIVDFETIKLRDVHDNLVLLCKECHSFVHSKKNVNGEYRIIEKKVAIQT